MRRPQDEIDAEVERLAAAAESASTTYQYDIADNLNAIAKVLRERMTPGQVLTAYGRAKSADERFDDMAAAANWAYGLTDIKPSEALS